MEIIEEAKWLISNKKATHVVIDGIQNSVPEIMRGNLKLEEQVLRRLKALNKSAVVVLAEVLYCPEHHKFNDALNLVNRQVRRLNRSLRTSQPTAVESSCLSQERQGQEAEGQSHRPP